MQAIRRSHGGSHAMAGQRRWPPNDRLVYERERRGWSQEEAAGQADQLAIRLGLRAVIFTGAQFGRWERGECRPRPPYLRVVCELYDASAEALGLCDPPAVERSALASDGPAGMAVSSPSDMPAEGERNMDRRAAMASMATVLGATLLEFTGALRHSNVGERMLTYIEADAARFATQYANVVPSECMIPTYNGDPWEVLALTPRGNRLAAGAGSAVVAKLAALEAKAQATLGNDGAARDALAYANRAMASATAQELQPGVFGFPLAKYFFYEGTCHVRLGQPDAALAASQQALALYQPTRAFMEPTIARIDMAMAYAKKGDLDQACQLSRGVTAIPAGLRTGPIMARVQEFFAGLEPRHRVRPVVQELREQLALPRPTETGGA